MTDTPHRAAEGVTPQPNDAGFTVRLDDGRLLWIPWGVSFALDQANSIERADTRISPDRTAIHWPKLRIFLRVGHLAELALATSGQPTECCPQVIDEPCIWRDAR